MVCLGNICRSPLAQGVMENLVDKNKLKVTVDSAGTAFWHIGEPPDPRSIEIAAVHGINIRNQRARQFNINDFDDFDIIYAMDSTNYMNIINLARSEKDIKKVKLILEELYPMKKKGVPDPYYGGEKGFEDVYILLENVCVEIIKNNLS